MGRPGYLQRWGYTAAPGALVQPPDGMAGDGLPTAYRPPAQWFNWCFGNWSDWINFLRGANHEHWTRTAWGTSPSAFDANQPLFLAVDTETADAVGAAFRYVIAGQETDTPANTAALRVSKRGNEWTRRGNVTATATALPCALAYAPNPAASGRWLLACDDASINLCTVDAGGGTGPVGSGSGNWSVATVPGGMTDVVAFAVKEATKIFALTVDGGVQSTDHGTTWTDYAGTSGTARSGNGSDACFTGNAFLFVTTDGQIYKSSTVGGVFAYVTDLGGTATWRLAADGAGGVLAYRAGSGSLLDIFWSADDGDTWETITPTAGFTRIQRVRHHAGTWLACSTVAPFLWASNDHEAWRKLRMPVGSDAALYDIAWDGGAWIVAGNGFVLQCPRGHDPGDADDAWSPGASSAPLVDAGYLRGREVSATAPTNGQTLVWNSTSGVWEPGTISASSPTTTRGDLIVRGASTDQRLAIGASGRALVSDGTDPAWVALTASHVSGVVPTTRTVAGLDLSADRSAASLASAVNVALVSTTQTGGSAGWTSSNGNGTAATGSDYALSFASGTATQVEPTTSHPRHVRSLGLDPLHSRWRVTARVVSAPNDASYRLALAVGNTALSAGVSCVIDGSASPASVEMGNYAPGYSSTVSGGSIPSDGTGWVRVTGVGNRITLECGTGTTTAQPSAWTVVGSGPSPATLVAQVVILYLARWAGSNGLGGAWDDITIEGFA